VCICQGLPSSLPGDGRPRDRRVRNACGHRAGNLYGRCASLPYGRSSGHAGGYESLSASRE
jgi:hypothetical protein